MATLYVRDFPDETYQALKTMAKEEKKSVGTEVIKIVEAELEKKRIKRERLASLARIRESDYLFKPSIDGKTTTDLLREDRDR